MKGVQRGERWHFWYTCFQQWSLMITCDHQLWLSTIVYENLCSWWWLFTVIITVIVMITMSIMFILSVHRHNQCLYHCCHEHNNDDHHHCQLFTNLPPESSSYFSMNYILQCVPAMIALIHDLEMGHFQSTSENSPFAMMGRSLNLKWWIDSSEIWGIWGDHNLIPSRELTYTTKRVPKLSGKSSTQCRQFMGICWTVPLIPN